MSRKGEGYRLGRDPFLTPKALDVLRLVVDGYQQRAIAKDLSMSVKCVNWYRKQLKLGLDAKTMPEAIAIAFRRGLLK